MSATTSAKRASLSTTTPCFPRATIAFSLRAAPFVRVLFVGAFFVMVERERHRYESTSSHADRLAALAKIPHVFVPEHHGAVLPTVAKVPDEMIPAYAAIRTPHAVLSDMFLIETERGCSRMCTYCVMRRSTNGGMRLASMERILELIPGRTR
jgi:radical SAM superfamily enzyme YgiQ (UPF0313 family)